MAALADWLVRQAPGALARPLGLRHRRALHAIQRCRTPALGGRVYACTHCASQDFAYHSCHHRACPRCGGRRTTDWTQRQTERLLPVPYFLVTFTVPEALRSFFAREPTRLIELLFNQSARALQEVASQPRHLGAELGMVGILRRQRRTRGQIPGPLCRAHCDQ